MQSNDRKPGVGRNPKQSNLFGARFGPPSASSDAGLGSKGPALRN